MVEMVVIKTGRVPKLAVVLWGVEFGKLFYTLKLEDYKKNLNYTSVILELYLQGSRSLPCEPVSLRRFFVLEGFLYLVPGREK